MRKLLKDTIGPIILSSITLDSYRRTIQSENKLESKLDEHNRSIEQKFQESTEVFKSVSDNTIKTLENFNLKIEPKSGNNFTEKDLTVKNSNDPGSSILNEVSNYNLNFKNPMKEEDLDKLLDIQEKIESISKEKGQLEEEILKYASLQANQFDNKEQLEEIDQKLDNFNEALNSLNKNRELEVTEMLNILSSYKGTDSSVVETSSEIIKSEIPFNLLDLISKYQDFLSNLDLDQIVALFNLVGYGTLMTIVFTIHSTFLSNKYIEKFNLEQKFPRLNKLFQIRKSLANKYFKFYIGLLYFYILIFIIGNLYMLCLKIFS